VGHLSRHPDSKPVSSSIDSTCCGAHLLCSETMRLPSGPRSIKKVKTMAKGQKRSNKEVKKPKQAKPKTPAAASLSSRLSESQERGKHPKK
jgi:hypothetical protein